MFHDDSIAGSWQALVQRIKTTDALGRWAVEDARLAGLHDVTRDLLPLLAGSADAARADDKELEYEGLVAGRPGQGTFVQRSLSQAPPSSVSALTRRLERWIAAARAAGLDEDGIMDVVRAAMRDFDAQASA